MGRGVASISFLAISTTFPDKTKIIIIIIKSKRKSVVFSSATFSSVSTWPLCLNLLPRVSLEKENCGPDSDIELENVS